MKAAVDPSGTSQAVIAGLKKGDQLKFVREPGNPDDPFAIRIETMSDELVGYVPRYCSRRIFMGIEYGIKFKILVDAVTKSKFGAKRYGVDIQLLYTAPDLSKLKRKKIRIRA